MEESLALKRETGNRNAILHSLLEIGTFSTAMGAFQEAHEYFCQALQLAQEIQTTALAFDILLGLADLYMKTGDHGRAAELIGFVCFPNQFD